MDIDKFNLPTPKRFDATIKESSDIKYVGDTVITDLKTAMFNDGNRIDITGRMHLGNGVWRLWADDFFMTVEEIQ